MTSVMSPAPHILLTESEESETCGAEQTKHVSSAFARITVYLEMNDTKTSWVALGFCLCSEFVVMSNFDLLNYSFTI